MGRKTENQKTARGTNSGAEGGQLSNHFGNIKRPFLLSENRFQKNNRFTLLDPKKTRTGANGLKGGPIPNARGGKGKNLGSPCLKHFAASGKGGWAPRGRVYPPGGENRAAGQKCNKGPLKKESEKKKNRTFCFVGTLKEIEAIPVLPPLAKKNRSQRR